MEKQYIRVKLSTLQDVKKFVDLSTKLEGDVFLQSGQYVVDGKSIMGIFSLSLLEPIEMEIIEKDERELDSFLYELEMAGMLEIKE